jgi:hypothetical protein
MARPRKKIDLVELEKLYTMQCTDREVAAFLGISLSTLERRRKVKKFGDVMDQAKAKGKVSVRRSLFRLATAGNVAAAIFLAKNLLGYRDVVNTEHSGPDGSAIQISSTPNLSQLTDEELKQLRAIAIKADTGGGDQPRTGRT